MNETIAQTMRFKLTKKKFMSLPDKVFLASNIYNYNMKSVFADEIWHESIRHLQWEIIKDCGADSRMCGIWESRKQYEDRQEELLKQYQNRKIKKCGSAKCLCENCDHIISNKESVSDEKS